MTFAEIIYLLLWTIGMLLKSVDTQVFYNVSQNVLSASAKSA